MTDELLARLVRHVQDRYYGKYRGFVMDNEDPEQRGRLRLRVPSVLGDQTSAWALPCLPFGGSAGHGWFAVPETEAQVWVEFEEGDVSRPIWTGTFWQAKGNAPAEARSTTRLLSTPSGHVLQFDDKEGEERFRLHHPSGAELTIDPKGTVALTDAQGATVVLDAEGQTLHIEDSHGNSLALGSSGVTVEDSSGNRVELGSSGVKVSGQQVVVEASQVLLGGQGGEPLLKGQSFLTLFATHVHTSSPTGGPTTPPIPQGEQSALSLSVKTT
jgi:uncharacterized protein involved in type VI secretion and phage assembly